MSTPRALNGRFIRVRNRNEYPSQEKSPKGEVHEDEGFISFDRARKKLVYRQFHVEGFVNQYVEDGDSSPSKVVFTSESLENIPATWRARKRTWSTDRMSSKRSSSSRRVGNPFEVYSRARLNGFNRHPKAEETTALTLGIHGSRDGEQGIIVSRSEFQPMAVLQFLMDGGTP